MRCTRSNHVPRPRRDRRQHGFSLIEILVAMTVTMLGLAGLMSLYTTSVQGNSRAARTVMASSIAQQTMEELRSLPVQTPVTGYVGPTLETRVGGIPVADAPLLPDIIGQDNTRYKRLVSVRQLVLPSQPLSQLLLVQVVISWTDEGAVDTPATDSRLRHRIVLESVRTRQDLL